MDCFWKKPFYAVFFGFFLTTAFLAPLGFSKQESALREPTLETVQLWNRLQGFLKRPVSGIERFAIEAQELKPILETDGLPGLDEYLHEVLEHVESLEVWMENGRIVMEVILDDANGLTLKMRTEEEATSGQLYSLVLAKKMRLELRSFKDNIFVQPIVGIKALVKLPVLPDDIFLESVEIIGEEQMLTIQAKTLWKLVRVVAKLDLKDKEFTGIDWWDSIFKNVPSLAKVMAFRLIL